MLTMASYYARGFLFREEDVSDMTEDLLVLKDMLKEEICLPEK
jgi:hypothetical protein